MNAPSNREEEIFEAALKLERLGRAGELTEVVEAFAVLVEEVGRLQRALEAICVATAPVSSTQLAEDSFS